MRLTDDQLRTFAVRADYPLQDAAAELLALRERVKTLEAALEQIAELQAETGYKDSIVEVARSQRDAARALLRECDEAMGNFSFYRDLRARIAAELGEGMGSHYDGPDDTPGICTRCGLYPPYKACVEPKCPHSRAIQGRRP